jgi:hypothetical protein
MQGKLCEWLDEKSLAYVDEHTVSKVKRRADFLILKDGKLINVEAKSTVNKTLIKQMNDHAKYCDYSFAFIPSYAHTPSWFKKELQRKGYGLIVCNIHFGKPSEITEALEAHYNRPKDRKLRKEVLEQLDKKLRAKRKLLKG